MHRYKIISSAVALKSRCPSRSQRIPLNLFVEMPGRLESNHDPCSRSRCSQRGRFRSSGTGSREPFSERNFWAGEQQIPGIFATLHRSPVRGAQSKDCLAVDAVSSEPLSGCISLVRGNLTGNSWGFGPSSRIGAPGILHNSRRLAALARASALKRTGNFFETSGNSNSL